MPVRLLSTIAILFLSLISQVAIAQTKSVREIIETQYIHGFPRDVAKVLSAADIPYLKGVIGDRGKSKYWGNAVAALAKIDDEQIITILATFFAELNGSLSPDEFRAASVVPSVLSSRSRNKPEIVEALKKLAEGEPSKILPIQFHESNDSIESTREEFRKIAIFSLGYSPSSEALIYLESAKNRAGHDMAEIYQSAIERARSAGASY